MGEHAYAIPEVAVTHERLDDEVIAINVETGFYYALVGPAADVWSAFDPVGTVQGVVAVLAARYDVAEEELRRDVDAFARQLQAAGLLTPVERSAAPVGVLPDTPRGTRWSQPELEEYRDMANLVLLDPIHQVDEKGWPHALPEPGA